MPVFTYRALNENGDKVEGEVEALNRDIAVASVRSLRLFPTQVLQKIEEPKKVEFHRTLILVEILSEEILSDVDYGKISSYMNGGDWSGRILMESNETIDGPLAAQLLLSHGSDPGFFQIDDNGNPTEGKNEKF